MLGKMRGWIGEHDVDKDVRKEFHPPTPSISSASNLLPSPSPSVFFLRRHLTFFQGSFHFLARMVVFICTTVVAPPAGARLRPSARLLTALANVVC